MEDAPRVEVREGLASWTPTWASSTNFMRGASGGHSLTAGTPGARAMAMYGGDASGAWS